MKETEAIDDELHNLKEETKNDVHDITEDQQQAILTQVIDDNDGYYEQYTISII